MSVHPAMFLEYRNRRFRRYEVSRFAALTSDISSSGHEKKLVNVGLGGCCFYESEGARQLKVRERVSCRFYLEGNTIELDARVVYVRSLQIGAKKVIQYGLEFGLGSRDSLSHLIERLDMMSQVGEVRLI